MRAIRLRDKKVLENHSYYEKSEDEKIAYIRQYHGMFEYVENPSENVQLAVIESAYENFYDRTKGNRYFKLIENPSELVQLVAVKRNGYEIQYIENPSEAVQFAAINSDPDSIQYIENPSEAVQLEAIRRDGESIQYIENPSEAVQLEAVKENGRSIRYIQDPSESVQLTAIREEAHALKNIKNPTKAVQLEVFRQKGLTYAINHVDNLCEELQYEMVKINPKDIDYTTLYSERIYQLHPEHEDFKTYKRLMNTDMVNDIILSDDDLTFAQELNDKMTR